MHQQIKIGANIWTIKEVANEFSLNPVMAETDNYKQHILIDRDINEIMKEQVLWHELLHAIGYTIDDERLKTDEAYVNTLSHFLVDIIKQLNKSKIDKFKGFNSEDIIK